MSVDFLQPSGVRSDRQTLVISQAHLERPFGAFPIPIQGVTWVDESYNSKETKGMVTSLYGNAFLITDPLCGEFISQLWIPLTKGQ